MVSERLVDETFFTMDRVKILLSRLEVMMPSLALKLLFSGTGGCLSAKNLLKNLRS